MRRVERVEKGDVVWHNQRMAMEWEEWEVWEVCTHVHVYVEC